MVSYKIIIGDNDERFLDVIKSKLLQMGHVVLDVDTSGTGLLRKIRSLSPDIVIADVNLKGLTGFEIAEIIEGENICPCIISLKGDAFQYKLNFSRKKVKTYLKKPVDYNEINHIIKHALNEFSHSLKDDKKSKEKQIVNEAKTLLMNKYKISEDEAYKYIRKKSMEKGINMYKLSLMLIDIIKKRN